MFWHNFKYAFKTLLKNRNLVFWTLAFPFILAILFNLAFARIHDYDVFEAFDIAVVDDEEFTKQTIYRDVFKTLGEGDERLFNIKYTDRDKAEEMLDDEEIEGYVYVDNEAKVVIKNNGTNQTVLTTVVAQITQNAKMVEDIAMTEIMRNAGQEINIGEIYQNAVKVVTEAKPKVKDESEAINSITIEFYTLIAMACMYGAMLSSEIIDRCLPNVTNCGKRVAITPVRKSIVVMSNLLASYVLIMISTIALVFFTRFVLNVEYGSDMGLIILLVAVGSLTATMFGMFLSIILKVNKNAKTTAILTVTMIGCLFAGMFGGMKNYFDEVLPFMNKINPVGLITDGFYSLYYYDDTARFASNVITLLIIAIILFALSIRNLRRRRYDSI